MNLLMEIKWSAPKMCRYITHGNLFLHLFPTQMQGQSPPAPVRVNKKAPSEEEGDEGEEQEEDGGQDIMDLLPRADVR